MKWSWTQSKYICEYPYRENSQYVNYIESELKVDVIFFFYRQRSEYTFGKGVYKKFCCNFIMNKCGAFDCVSSSQCDDWLAIKSQIRNTQKVSIFPNPAHFAHTANAIYSTRIHIQTYIEAGKIFLYTFVCIFKRCLLLLSSQSNLTQI